MSRDEPGNGASGEVADFLHACADWSSWVPWAGARSAAPRLPGVYLFRVRGRVVYCGMAGERAGRDGSRAPQGLWGRLGRYGSGRAAASGFGEAALDRALADPAFVTARLTHLRDVGPERTLLWAVAAIEWAAPEVCWTVTDATSSARALESRVRAGLLARGVELWGKR